jgi:hypothetical protein
MNSHYPSEATERSFAPLTSDHLARLVIMAERDHLNFTRAAGQPEYADRRVARPRSRLPLQFLCKVRR